MGIYVGPAPGGTIETWRHEAARLRVLLGHPNLAPYIRNAAQAQLNDLKRCLERSGGMSYENTNKQTPRPPFDPPLQTIPPDLEWEALRDEFFAWREANPGKAFIGLTTRLAKCCAGCGDELPAGAVFCIECGEKV